MTKEGLAALITGSEYPFDLPKHLILPAEIAGLVVVYGASDDLMELRGALCEEFGAYESTEILLTRNGVFQEDECASQCRYYEAARQQARKDGRTITALWKVEGYSWMYKTAIPHATFEIVEEGEKYCRGIVFSMAEVEPGDRSREET